MPHRLGPAPLPAALLLLLLVAAAFGAAAGNPFVVYDDPQYVTANRVVSGGLTAEGAAWAFRSVEQSNWHPLTWLSHMADVSIFGLSPAGPHAENVLLHALASILLYLALREGTGEGGKSLAAALLFALHPLRVEPVAWVAQRKELLCALFWFLGVLAHARYARRPSASRYAAVAACLVLALLSKPMAVTFPFALLLLDYWPLRRFPFAPRAASPGGEEGVAPPPVVPTGRLLLEKVPLLLLSAASCAVTYLAQSAGGSTAGAALPFPARLATALASAASYLGKVFLPVDLAVFYPHPYLSGAGVPPWKWAGALLLLASLTVLAVRERRRRPFLPVGWLWFLGTLVPVIGLVQVGLQGMADRYAHVPSVGLAVAVAWGVPSLLPEGERGRRAATALAAAALLLLGAGSFAQVRHWRSSSLLFERAVTAGGESFVSLDLLGLAYAGDGRHAEAVDAFTGALRLNPSDPKVWSNLAVSLDASGQPARAAEAYRRVLRLRPGFGAVAAPLALALAKSGDAAGALAALAEGTKGPHGDPAAGYPALAAYYEKGGKLPLAAAVYEEMVRRDPGSAEGWNNLGVDYGSMGRYGEAHGAFLRAASLRPSWGDAWYNAGVAAALAGKGKEAREALSSLSAVEPGRAPALAAFLAGRGM
jgi:tetratricopeptide (TPR) repeat protein